MVISRLNLNKMVHFYKEISAEELYSIINKDLKDIEKFPGELQGFLEKYKNKDRSTNSHSK